MTTEPQDLRIDGARLWNSIGEMAAIGAGVAGGCNRQALTDEDRRGREHFIEWARAAGCTITVDQVGNIFARRRGRDDAAAPVLAGSHLDTQATGGRFDGVYGVLSALEVVRTLEASGTRTKRPIEVVVWTNEEGCRFVPAMLGSGVVAGAYTVDYAYERSDADGKRFGAELERIGFRGSAPATARPFAAVFEAHIEQGPVLESDGCTIGVVEGIQGAYWFDVLLTGQSCHAGPTPMAMRRDPWRAALPIIAGAFAIAEHAAPWGRCTVGAMQVQPGARNTVPGSLAFPIDIRHPDRAVLDRMVDELRALVQAQSAHHRIEGSLEQIWHMPATRFDERLVDLVESTSAALGYSHRRLVSGAGHDSLHTARFAPTAMIFVPCKGGLSHNEAEDATPADLAAGANVLLHSILRTAET